MKENTEQTYTRIIRSFKSKYINDLNLTNDNLIDAAAEYINSARKKGTFNTRVSAFKYAFLEEEMAFKNILSKVIKPEFEKVESKRLKLKKLPVDWQVQIFERFERNKSTYLRSLAILMSTGCRPIELEKGIVIRKNSDDVFELEIKSAKKNEGNKRIIRSNNPALNTAFNDLNLGGETEIITNKKRLATILRETANSLSLNGVSAYSYRHAFSSDLKASEMSSEEISIAMGHISISTQRMYGFKRAGQQTHVIGVEIIKPPSFSLSM